MANDKNQQTINVVLSRDELTLVLNLLQAATLNGLGADPLGELSAQQAEMSAVVAARGLRARDLARVDAEDGKLLVHVGVLGAVATCVTAEVALFAYHWEGDNPAPQRWFGYRSGDTWVVHRPVEDVLHRFTVLMSGAQLIEEALASCQIRSDGQLAMPGEIYMNGNDFARVRQLAAAGYGDQALAPLDSSSAAPILSSALVKTLAARPQISILQVLTRQPNGEAQQDFTLVQNQDVLWLMTPVAGNAERVCIQSVTRTDVYDLLLHEMIR